MKIYLLMHFLCNVQRSSYFLNKIVNCYAKLACDCSMIYIQI